MKHFLGLDPGKNGAIGIITTTASDKIIQVFDMDNIDMAIRRFSELPNVFCCVEKVHGMKGDGASRAFNFGKSTGIAMGYLKAFRIPFFEVAPSK